MAPAFPAHPFLCYLSGLRCGAVSRRRLRQAFRTADAAFRGCRPTFSDPGGSVLPARLRGAEKIRFLHLPALRQLPGESPRLRPVFRLKLRGPLHSPARTAFDRRNKFAFRRRPCAAVKTEVLQKPKAVSLAMEDFSGGEPGNQVCFGLQ